MLLIVVSIATTLPDERVRYWNGYMLFYEKMEEPAKTPVSAKKSKIQTRGAGGRVSYQPYNDDSEDLSLCLLFI